MGYQGVLTYRRLRRDIPLMLGRGILAGGTDLVLLTFLPSIRMSWSLRMNLRPGKVGEAQMKSPSES